MNHREPGEMLIGELAEASGVGVETLRFYEREGLLPEPPRSDAGYRLYGVEAVKRVRFILKAKELGFTLSSGFGAATAALGASLATLVCCVLPSLLVVAGFGTTVAAVTSSLPWLVALSRYKGWVFLAAGALIVASRIYAVRVTPRVTAGGAACPTALGRWTRRIWWASVVLYGVGVLAVYVVGPLLLGGGG